jgi:hypothetical protein
MKISADGSVGARFTQQTRGCVSSSTTLCIDDRAADARWKVEVLYNAGAGNAGSGHSIPLGSLGVTHGGLFWFFGAGNPEMLIKILNACSVNQNFWVFYAAGTNVGLTTTVTDTKTGRFKSYPNEINTAAPPIQDTSAFSCSAADTAAAPEISLTTALAELRNVHESDGALSFPDTPVGQTSLIKCSNEEFGTYPNTSAGTLTIDKALSPPFSMLNLHRHTGSFSSENCESGTPVSGFPVNLNAGEMLVWDFQFAPTQTGSFQDAVTISGLKWNLRGNGVGAGGCTPDSNTLCVDGRFEIQIAYDTGSRSGLGTAIPLTSLGVTEGGLFWFFGPDNPEALIKVIDGCSVNNKKWVFFSASTDVGLNVTVTDTQTGQVAIYKNANGTAAVPVQDTNALPCS